MGVYEDRGCVGCGLDADNCICDDRDECEDEDEDGDEWACAFPGRCLMPGEHLRYECHTVESYREFLEDVKREGIL